MRAQGQGWQLSGTLSAGKIDKYKTGKVTPEGDPDPSVFSTDFNREGIQVGTAVSLLVRKYKSRGAEIAPEEKACH